MTGNEQSTETAFVHSYAVDLLFDHPIDLGEHSVGPFTRTGARYESQPADGTDWRLVMDAAPRAVGEQDLAAPLLQSWSWSDARAVVPSLSHRLTLRDLRPGGVDSRSRISAINSALRQLCEILPTRALHWIPTEQLVDPAGFMNAFDFEGAATAYGAINVRMFRIDRYEDGSPIEHPETIMDTLGLSALGLDDFQLHFRSLDPALAGDYLYRTALHEWNGGARLQPGSQIEGFDGQPWSIELEEAIIEPERGVLDIRTGETGLAGR